jgi:CBS-domain-containing membrane protein
LLSAPAGDRPIEELTVENICTSQVLCTYADESLAEALKRMAARDLRQMPVVDRNQPKRVIGMVDRLAITTAYNTALTKRAIAARMTAIKATAAITAKSSSSNNAGDKDNNLDNNLDNNFPTNNLKSNSNKELVP